MSELITGVFLVLVGAVATYFVLRNKKNGVQEALDSAVVKAEEFKEEVEAKVEELKAKKDAE